MSIGVELRLVALLSDDDGVRYSILLMDSSVGDLCISLSLSQYLSAVFILAPDKGALSVLLDVDLFLLVFLFCREKSS